MKTKSPFDLQKILKSEIDYKKAMTIVSLMLLNCKLVPLWTYCNLVNNKGISQHLIVLVFGCYNNANTNCRDATKNYCLL